MDKQLQFLGYILSTTPNPESPGFTMGGDANQDKNAMLTIQNISLESSGVYFCAARFHNAAYCRFTVQKALVSQFISSLTALHLH